jgi:hypothetical protein
MGLRKGIYGPPRRVDVMPTRSRNRILQAGFLFIIGVCVFSVPTQAKYGGGSGTVEDPYKIATAEHLIALGETPEDYDKHLILTRDIDLDPNLPGGKVFDKAVIAPDTDLVESYFQGTLFRGVFDGNDHTISRLTVQGKGYLGIFGQLQSGAEVRNLGVVDVNIAASGGYVGGLVGYNDECSVTHCYSSGEISGGWRVGGLVGGNSWGGDVSACYSTGAVSGKEDVGGLVGYKAEILFPGTEAVVTASFWDTETSDRATSAGGTGKTTAQMKQRATFVDWDFANVWDIAENQTYPYIRRHSIGDFNYDCHVDLLDLAVLAEHWLEGLE